MTALSKSKPVVSMARLAQLLEERQEPFKLEVYLSERRYTKKSFDRIGSRKVKWRIAIPNGSKILKSAINKLVSYKNCQKSVHCKDRGIPAFGRGNKQQHNSVRNFTSLSFPLPCQSTFQASKLHNLRDLEVATNTKDSKQLSPVSVLEELPSNEAKKEEIKPISAFNFPRKAKSTYLCEFLLQSLTEKHNCVSKTELQDVKSSSDQHLKPKQVSMQTKQLLFNCVTEAMDTYGKQGRRQRSGREGLGPEEFGKVICEQISSLEEQYRDVKYINQLIDLNGTTEEWRNFQRWNKEIGKVIADAVLDDIITETINFEVYCKEPFSGNLVMVSIGSKALPLRKHKTSNLTEDSFMAGEDNPYGKHGKKGSMSRKSFKKRPGFDGDHSTENLSGGMPDNSAKSSKVSKHQNVSVPQTSFVRKQVDPETAKYYLEIANVIEGTEVDLEERSIICGNALEESRGKEVELATDYYISHTMQALLEGCDVDHLCEFLQSCAKDFPHIAMDRSGSHVAETALKSLAMHLQDDETYSLIENTLTTICQVIIDNPIDMMCNCYGSHVLRSLLCFCKGVPLDSSEFHATKSSTILAERLNLRPSRVDENDSQYSQQRFPDVLKFLVSGMLNCARKDISTLQTDQYSSLVLQTALKLYAGHEEGLSHIIPILLGCNMENAVEGNFIEKKSVQKLLRLMKETAYSHLMEVIVEVAPETLYNELFTKVFRNSLFQMSSHHCGNFVVQALISHARCQSHMELIWEELGPKFTDLLEMGRSGVTASLIAASLRLHSHEHKCLQALAAAVHSVNESIGCIVPRILFLENYFSCGDKSNWNWPNGVKMHLMGSLILQLVIKFSSDFIQPFITSITSMEVEHVLEASKDPGGQRVVEAFLSSNVSGKQKRRLAMKLRGHFGGLALHPSGSFTVEKCFIAGNLSLREAIVSELLEVQTELSKTKHGPVLLRKLDVDGFARRPDQWKSRQASKQSAYKEFYATFGSKETKSSKTDHFLAETPHTSQPEKLKEMRKEIEASLGSATAPSSSTQFLANEDLTTKVRMSGHKRHAKREEQHGDDVLESKNKKQKKKKNPNGIEHVAVASESSHPVDKTEKKRRRKDGS